MKNKSDQDGGNAHKSSRKGTFIIKVEYCQNKTWQGRITWAEENKQVTFRSALEMVKLMSEVLEQAGASKEKINEHSVS